jgi:RHS repeat-associated protein
MSGETIYVGDPVDVITGNQFDLALDFRIAWSFPFQWQRLYSAVRCRESLALGWGHTHSYDHRLSYNIDGLLYVDPRGNRYQFRIPRLNAPVSEAPGGMLWQVRPNIYRVQTQRQPQCDFQFVAVEQPARLVRVYLGRAFHALNYGPDGAWTSLTYANEPPVRIESSGGRLEALTLIGLPGGGERALWRGEYDAGGDLIAVTDVRGIQRFEYDSAHRMIRHVDRLGYAFLFTYDKGGRCVRSSGGDGVQDVRLSFRPSEKRSLVTRADGGEWQYLYDNDRINGVLDPYGGITRIVYGDDGSLVEEIGPSGEPLRSVADPESGVIEPAFGPPTWPTLPLGDPWFESLAAEAGVSDTLGWDGFGTAIRRASITLPSHDANRRWPVRLPAGVVQSLTFTGSPPYRADPSPSGGWISPASKKPMLRPAPAGIVHHDSFGNRVSHQLPDGKHCRWRYDANGNVIRYVDYERSEWRSEYASWNHCVAEIDPLGYRTAFEYNRLEKLVAISDPGGTRTEHAYDLKDRLIERTRDGRKRDRFDYDLSDRLVQVRRGGGEARVGFEYGPHGRPVLVAPEGQPVREYEYDHRGRLLAVTAAGKPTLAFAYDRFGALATDLQHGQGVKRRFAALRLIETVVLDCFSTRYQRSDDQVAITDPTGRRHIVRRLDRGVFLLERSNGVQEVSQYDWSGRCLSRSRFRGTESFTIWCRTWRYSGVGALLEATNSHDESTLTYQYDPAHRLTGANGPRGSMGRFRMDEAGNIRGAPGLHHATLDGNRLVAANGGAISHDERGNIVEDRSNPRLMRYVYDEEDRLILCDAGGERISFTYDALGRRLTKTTAAGDTRFVWEGERLAAEISPSKECRVYVYADENAMTPFLFIDYDDEASDPASGRLRHVFTDQASCPVLVEDEETRVLWRASIAPYGAAEVWGRSQLMLNLRWPGHYHDIETGLHYNRHRYYSPALYRYIQPDLRDVAGGVNVYAYSSRPLDTVDVNGLAPCPKKPMIPGENVPDRLKQQADELADAMRAALEQAVENGTMHPLDAAGVTLAAMVVLRNGEYEVVVTGNVNPASLPPEVYDPQTGPRVVGFDDDRPPRVGPNDDDWRFPRQRPDGTFEPTTHLHAEQRGMRAVDCDDSAQGVGYIAPTRPCCPGCNSAIQTPMDQGGWGGTGSNISNLGRSRAPWTTSG